MEGLRYITNRQKQGKSFTISEHEVNLVTTHNTECYNAFSTNDLSIDSLAQRP